LGWLTTLQAIIYADLGELETARELAERSLEMNTNLGQVILESWSINALAYVSKDELEGQRILDLCKKLGEAIDKTDNVVSRVYLGEAFIGGLLELGYVEEAQKEIKEYIQLVDRAGMMNFQGVARRLRGQILAAEGNGQAAEEAYQNAAARFDELGSLIDLARTLVYLGRLYIDGGNKTQAQPVLQRALGIFEECGAKGCTDETGQLLDELDE
jgi:tetratricopeptide (TPR) repeat protein